MALGTSGAWVTQLGSAAAGDGFVLEQGGRSQAVAGRWLAIEAGSAGVVAYGGHRYRGRLLVYLNDRGLLNVINETALEDYLRGVVPRELGPEAFPELEALKAQAVAARTYTLRNLGEFTREGYDICATPRCQVYGGRDAEHPFSDRAVAETAGEVLLWEGELVDALYSSTCGGHTENAEVVFPLKQAPYLRGVACVEDGGQILPGRNDSRPLVTTVLDLLLPPAVGDARQRAAQRGRDLAEMAGLAVPPVELASLERRAVQRFAGALFDLAVDARLFLSDADLEYLVTSPPDDWSAEDRRLAAYLAHAGWLQPGPGTVLDSVAVDGLWFELARHLRILEERSVRVVDVVGDRLHTRGANGNVAEHPLDGDLVLYQRYGSQLEALPVRVLPGDRVELVFAGPRLLALIHPVVAGGAAFDRGSQRSRWEVFHSQAELAGQVAERYPGFQLSDFEVLERGVSGRVGALLLKGREGQEQRVEGLAVRWTLDLPDTWFSARRLDPPEGEAGWLFTGRGWGHGVGLCQVGAFGMARRGADYRAILLHYYSGVELVELTPVS